MLVRSFVHLDSDIVSWRSFVRSFVRSFICLVRCVALHCVALHCVVGIVVVGGGGDGYSFGVVVALCELVLCCCDSQALGR